jgi:M6 family metalloprotease-like protein
MLYRALPLCLIICLLAACSSTNTVTTNPIPTLDTRGDVYKTMGPNDPLIYGDALGTKKLVVLFVDFPDRKAKDETTEQRAAKTLGGTAEDGTFQTIFRTNSYGKLALDITQAHGWRTMPESYKLADPVTTEGHRKMFEQAFALYPEIDFNEYDCALVLMSAKGNFAFGTRDDEAIPHRGEKINVAVTQSSRNPYTLAHEYAHCLGLPDVYTYGNRVPEGTSKNPFGPWDIMSGPSTGFIGWHRHKLEWLDEDRKTYLTEGTHTFTLTPLSDDAGVSMIVVPALGEDASNPSKVYCIEVAQYLRPGRKLPRPRGVLVYSIDAKLPTGFNPAVVYPAAGRDKMNAALHEGEAFEQDDTPLSLRVIKQNDDNSYEVEVVVK